MKKANLWLVAIAIILNSCGGKNPVIEKYRLEQISNVDNYIKRGDIKPSEKQETIDRINRNFDSLISLWGEKVFADTIKFEIARQERIKKMLIQDSIDNIIKESLNKFEPKITDTINGAWEYREDKDQMTEAISYYAENTSLNSEKLLPPYDNGTNLRLVIRKSNGKNEILLIASDGQYASSYSNEYVKIKFDDEKPFNVSFGESASGKSNVLFLHSESKLISKMKASKKMKVEVWFYDNGKSVFDFDVSKLNWKH